MLKFKEGVVVARTTIIAAGVFNAWLECGFMGDCTITSGNDGKHMVGSRHYTNQALDFRTNTISVAQAARWATAIRSRLGAGYDVVVEIDHIHVEEHAARPVVDHPSTGNDVPNGGANG